jgi:hypothetical protein
VSGTPTRIGGPGMLLYETAKPVTLDQLEDRLATAFRVILTALREGETVVVAVDDEDIQGAGELPEVALAHGLLGLCRAFAIEGKREGWMVTVLSSTADVAPAERARWIEQLGRPGVASGSLVRLGGGHLGRVPA